MRIIRSIAQGLSYLGIVLLLLLMLLTVADVFMRYFFSNPITGTYEIDSMIMICLALGFGWCALQGRNISVDIVISHFPPRIQAIVDSLTLIAGFVLCTIIIWQGILDSIWEVELGSIISVQTPMPKYPFWWIFVISFIMLCLVMLLLLIDKVKTVIRG